MCFVMYIHFFHVLHAVQILFFLFKGYSSSFFIDLKVLFSCMSDRPQVKAFSGSVSKWNDNFAAILLQLSTNTDSMRIKGFNGIEIYIIFSPIRHITVL